MRARSVRSRRLARTAAWFLFGAVAWPAPRHEAVAQTRRPVVHVFLPLDATSSVVGKMLRDQLPALDVTVFGRFRDFEDALAKHPDAVVAITPVLDYQREKVTLQGQRGGKSMEAYVLASVGQPLDGSLSGKTIGVVDLMGREGTQMLLAGLVKVNDIKMKRVAKVEDLLPLLEFATADGVVLSSASLPRLSERTRLGVRTRELAGAMVGLPAIAVLNPATRDVVVSSFEKLDLATKRLLGIDGWRVQ